MHLAYPAVLAALLFCTGLYGVLARRNAILVLMSVELMLNAVNLNLVAFDVWLRDALHALPGPDPLHHRDRRRRDRHRPRDRADGVPQPGHLRRRPAARHRRGPRARREQPERGHRVSTTTLAVLVPLLPFLGAVAGLLLGRTAPGFVRPLAILPTLGAAVLAVLVAVRQGGGETINAATELTPTGSVPIDLSLYIDGFAALVAVLVGVVATCVQVYSTAYLREDPRYPSYAALVSLFTSAMLLVVYSGDLMVLLVGWEVMGICSYFLVGHYWETEAARSASLKAFLVTKLGDVPFLIGLFALAADAGSFEIPKILGTVAAGGLDHPTLIALLLLMRRRGQVRAVPLAHLAPRRHGGPHPGLGAHPRRDDGRRRCLLHRPPPARLRGLLVRAGGHGRDGGRHDGRLRPGRHRPGRHQAGARVLHDRPARLHGRRPGRRRPRRRRVPPPVPRRLQGAPLPRQPA